MSRKAASSNLETGSANEAVVIDGVHNFRDLGGRQTVDGNDVRRGRVYRSASLDAITPRGLRQLEATGVRTVVDLRSHAELERHGRFPFEETAVRWIHLPSTVGPPVVDQGRYPAEFDHPDPMRIIYRRIVTEGSTSLSQALHILADVDSHPVIFHCTSGKDRTGMLAMVLNLIIGVSLEHALADYEQSAFELAPLKAEMRARYPEMDAIPSEVIDRIAGVDRSWVIDALADVGALPDPAPWLGSIGVEPSVRHAIRAHLVDDPTG